MNGSNVASMPIEISQTPNRPLDQTIMEIITYNNTRYPVLRFVPGSDSDQEVVTSTAILAQLGIQNVKPFLERKGNNLVTTGIYIAEHNDLMKYYHLGGKLITPKSDYYQIGSEGAHNRPPTLNKKERTKDVLYLDSGFFMPYEHIDILSRTLYEPMGLDIERTANKSLIIRGIPSLIAFAKSGGDFGADTRKYREIYDKKFGIQQEVS